MGDRGECARREAAMRFAKCERKDCGNPGVLLPQVWLWATGDEAKVGHPLKIVLALRVCEMHARTLTEADYLGEHGFQALSALIISGGYAAPSRETIEIHFASVQNAEMN